jgi:hypothetical protein
MIQAILFSIVLGRRKAKDAQACGDLPAEVEIEPGENEAFATMNDGALVKLPRFLRPIILYVCPIYLIVLLVSFTATDGLPFITLSNVDPAATVTFLGHTFPQVGFTWAFRGFLLLLFILLNVAIAYAWRKGGPAEKGRSKEIKKVAVGNSDETDNAADAVKEN